MNHFPFSTPQPSTLTSEQQHPSSSELPIVTDSVSRRFAFFASDVDKSKEVSLGFNRKPIFETFGVPVRSNDDLSQVVMSVVWHSGTLGAALYNPETATIDLLRDIPEDPTYQTLQSLVRSASPCMIVVSHTLDDKLREILKELVAAESHAEKDDGDFALEAEEGDSQFMDHSRLLPDQRSGKARISLLPGKDFALGPAKQRIARLRLPCMPEDIASTEIHSFLSTFIDFQRFCMVRALGGLLVYLDKHPGSERAGPSSVLAVRMFSMEGDVVIDQNSMHALRVFHTNSHPSAFKAGKASKEGVSLYALFNRCRSTIGARMLRLWFSRPTQNPSILRSRHQAIRFFMNADNAQVKVEFEKLLLGIKDVRTTMGRMSKGACTLNDWIALQKTAENSFILSKIVSRENLPLDIEIFGKIQDYFVKDLGRIARIIHNVVDAEASVLEERIVVKPGIVEELDDLKRSLYRLNETLTVIANEEVSQIEGLTREIRITYIPHMGYLLVLNQGAEDGLDGSYERPGLEFVFKAKSGLFYKSERTRQLDNDFGDLVPKIHDFERAVLMQLQEIVLRYTRVFQDIMEAAAELDCLIAMANVATSRNYTVPQMGNDIGIMIEEGRHPLQELYVPTFVPNSTSIGYDENRVNILTGPNMSGKSVYLKQVAVMVFLAHVGCPVPASVAKIGYTDKIFTRLLSDETVALRQSAFLIDLTQVGLAVNYATNKSLIILDEFGKGTRASDGLALLASILRFFSNRSFDTSTTSSTTHGLRNIGSVNGTINGRRVAHQPPVILLATHFHTLMELVPTTTMIRYLTLDTVHSDGQSLVFLYKVKTGMFYSSHATLTSRAAGFSEKVVERMQEMTEKLRDNKPIEPLAKLRTSGAGFCDLAGTIVEKVKNFDPVTHDARAILDEVLCIVRRKSSR
ncbi:hypothetical protein RvY_09339 [Ramazzottius varieornatus]|uniref:DNA mismatch repair proteins mutS family domain-containing protein n=1 Tax=Ramazzottius varieornatus TaxID=947166 RepID=A0A1D1V902_RAMVA|nr:hypothetical protein RvY_09339 [Ramazzottius varieornatus]